ncbi:hypothetical protein [Lysobacter gummosus]
MIQRSELCWFGFALRSARSSVSSFSTRSRSASRSCIRSAIWLSTS